VIALSSVWTFFIVAGCVAFLFGLLRRRMLLAGALARLGAALRASDDRAQIRDELATALGDSTTELLFHVQGSGACMMRGAAPSTPRRSPPAIAL
jgi:hypothetical protein